MTEPFRVREAPEAHQELEIAPQAPKELVSDKLAGNELKAEEPLSSEEKKLDIWEGLFKRKYVTEYFDIGNIDHEFNLKMQTSAIDKYIRGELESRQYEKNIENWEKILQEIEEEIGSKPMELFSRIKKIVGYINAVNRLKKAKELKEKYLNSI
jgi:hypothetical protein